MQTRPSRKRQRCSLVRSLSPEIVKSLFGVSPSVELEPNANDTTTVSEFVSHVSDVPMLHSKESIAPSLIDTRKFVNKKIEFKEGRRLCECYSLVMHKRNFFTFMLTKSL